MTAADAPCGPWATLADVRDCDSCASEVDYPDALLEQTLLIASAWLYRRSGRRFPAGVEVGCADIVRPVFCYGGRGYQWVSEHLVPAPGRHPSYGRARDGTRLDLPLLPVRAVSDVWIDGVAFTDYRVDDHRTLVRLDGETWPSHQEWTLDPSVDADSGWQVHYTHGLGPPADMVRATAVLACELARACASDSGCRLPRGTQSVARSGLSISLMDPTLENGRFGMIEVDGALHSLNPAGLMSASEVMGPQDLYQFVRPDTSIP